MYSLFNIPCHALSAFIPCEMFLISNMGGRFLWNTFCLKYLVVLWHYLSVRNSLSLIQTTKFNQHSTSCNKIHISQIKYKFDGPNVVTFFLILCKIGLLLAKCYFWEFTPLLFFLATFDYFFRYIQSRSTAWLVSLEIIILMIVLYRVFHDFRA
jgi:hypothetical protein